MGISSAGVGSGLDINSIITQLMAVEQQPLNLLQTRASAVQGQISAYGKIKSTLDALRSAASDLSQPVTWGAKAVTLSDAKVASVTATNAAVAGTYSLEVTQLASAQRLATGAYADASAMVGTGTITLETGAWNGGAFTAKGGTSPVTITIDATNNTLAGVRDAINASGAAVRASIVTDASGSRLVLGATDSGASNQMRITVADADGNNADSAGLSALAYQGDTSATSPGAHQVQAGQDAQMKLDGLAITSSSNALTGAVDGLSINLSATNAGNPATITVSVDSDAARKLVDRFVSAYNDGVKLFADDMKVDPAGKANGILLGDAAARNVSSSLRTLATRRLPSGALTSLSQAGISIGRDGTLSVDSTKFASAISSGTANLAALFTAAGDGTSATKGIALAMRDMLTSALGTDGTIQSRADGLATTLKNNQHNQDTLQQRLTQVEARLRAQYTALDADMSRLQGISAGLTQQLAQLTGSTKSGN